MLFSRRLKICASGHGRDSLHGDLDILLQVLRVLVFERQILHKLPILSLEDQILFSEVRAVHLLDQLLGVKVLQPYLVKTPFHLVHFGKQSLNLVVLFSDHLPQLRGLVIDVLSTSHELRDDFVFLLDNCLHGLHLLLALLVGVVSLEADNL